MRTVHPLDPDRAEEHGVAMEFDSVSAEEFGASLRGIGLNILVHDVEATCAFLAAVFDLKIFRKSADFAIVQYGQHLFQLHSDGTYHSNPLLGLVPEHPPRGGGLEIRLFETDPDEAVAKAEAAGGTILQAASDKPHGLREAYILCTDGYAWVPSRPL